MILDIGCGETKKGDIGLDVRKIKGVDILADARVLPFRDNILDCVYSSHTIEHFSHREVRNIVSEWIRVLKHGGIVEILCPNLRARAFLFVLSPTWQNVENIYGGQDYLDNYHKCGFSFDLLKSILESNGIMNIKRIISGYKGIPFIPDCLHVKGIKK